MNKFSLLFEDPKIEMEYQRHYYKDIKNFAWLYVLEVYAAFLLVMIFNVYRLAITPSYPNFKYMCVGSFFFIACPTFHYVLLRFNMKAALLFSSI